MVTTSLFWISIGLALAYAGAEAFIRGSVSAARRLRIPPLVVGLTIIAWGTSAPELAVSLDAALNESQGVSLGNVLGSNIFNVGIILGLSALVYSVTVKLQLIRFDIPILVGISVLLLGSFYDSRITRVEGMVLFACFLLYSAATFYLARRAAPPEVIQEFTEAQPRAFRSIPIECILIAGGLALLIYGADLLVDGAVILARNVGVTESVIGLTVVAAGTSLPELVTSVVAAARKEPDVVVGNIVGSNIFNVTCILGLSSIIAPTAGSQVGPVDLFASLMSAVILLPMAWTGFVLRRWEGLVLLLAYAAYIAYVWL